MPLSSRFVLRAYGLHSATAPTNDLGVGTAAAVTIDQLVDFTLANGTAAGQADRIFSDTRTVNASTNDDLDLAGVLTDSFAATITFVKIKGLFIRSAAANAQNFTVGNATSNAWATLLNATGTVTMRPGATLLLAAGSADATAYAVTAGTGDILRVANGAGSSITYDIIVIGTSA